MRSEALTVVSVKIMVLCDALPCGLTDRCRYLFFGGTGYLWLERWMLKLAAGPAKKLVWTYQIPYCHVQGDCDLKTHLVLSLAR
jgi:hypothetical protein